MQIQNISPVNSSGFASVHKANKNLKAASNPVNSTACGLYNSPAFCGLYDYVPYSEQSFIEWGGTVKFGEAEMGGVPYNGRLVSESKNVQIQSSHIDGKKTSIRYVFNQGNGSSDVVVDLRKESEQLNIDGTKTVFWQNADGDVEYVEDYDESGKLNHTEFLGYGKYDSSVPAVKISCDFSSSDGSLRNEVTRVSADMTKMFGYSMRTVNVEGNKITETKYNTISDNGKRTAEKRTDYFSGSILKKSEEENVRYYSDDKTPYAISKRRVESKNREGKWRAVDFDYLTADYTQGAGPVRRACYTEHPSTIRETVGDRIKYFDGITKKCYAMEHIPAGSKVPDMAVNFETDSAFATSSHSSNTLLLTQYNKDEKAVSATMFQISNGRYIIKQTDVLDPETGKKRGIARFLKDGMAEFIVFDENGKAESRTTEEEPFAGSLGSAIFKMQ